MELPKVEGESFKISDPDHAASNNEFKKQDITQLIGTYQQASRMLHGSFASNFYEHHTVRMMAVDILSRSSASKIAVTQDRVRSIGKTGLDAAGDPTLVAIVKEDTDTQEAILSGQGPKPTKDTTAYILKRALEAEAKPGFQRDAGDLIYLREAARLKKEDGGDAGYIDMTEMRSYKDSIIKTLSAKERNELDNPVLTFSNADSLPVGTYGGSSILSTKASASPVYPSSVDINLDEIGKVPSPSSLDIMGDVREAEPRVENILSRLNARKGKSLERLKNFGLNGLVKGLETFGKLSHKKRLLAGVTFAGLSVATGGLPAFVGMSLSTMSFASTIYKKNIEKLKKKDDLVEGAAPDTEIVIDDETKRKAALIATGYGILLALSTSFVISHVVDAVQATGSVIAEGFNSLTHHDVPSAPAPHPVAPVEAVSTAPVQPTAPVVAATVPAIPAVQEVAHLATEVASSSAAPAPVPNLAEIAQNVQQQIVDAAERAHDASRGISRQ